MLILVTSLSSLYFAGAIIHENIVSETKGPVHWHADYQIWACGERIDLKNPQGLSNKIGTPLFHEHDDDRIHVEGTVMEVKDVELGDYFEVIGGKLEKGHLIYPGQNQTYNYQNGDTCPNGQTGQLKVYVNGERIQNYTHYLPYPDPYVPPGDCIIVEFGPNNSQTTNKLCSSWETQDWNYNNWEEKREDTSEAGREWQ